MSGEQEGSSRAGGRRFSALAREFVGDLPEADQAVGLAMLRRVRDFGGPGAFRVLADAAALEAAASWLPRTGAAAPRTCAR
mmetsp:Transcript_8581/g.25819  ORF Transcript_8581/g.25819 Transcript_8581/m.25819 type:complete len:81 (+) Transcript_8581:306-548(+)